MTLEDLMRRRRKRQPPDFLDEIMAESTRENPEFPRLVEAAVKRRRLLRSLAAERERSGVSQTVIAAKMNTSQSAVARLEAGEIDAKISTIDRFAAALGRRIEWRVVATRRTPLKRAKRAS